MARVSRNRSRWVLRRFGRSVISGMVLAGWLALVPGGSVAAQDYSLDYGTLGVGGAVCDTADYGFVDTLTIQGATGEPAESADYQLVPPVAVDSAPPSSVPLWMFY